MTEAVQPPQFLEPTVDTPAHLRHPDDPEFRHLDGSPSQIPRLVDTGPREPGLYPCPDTTSGVCLPNTVCDTCQAWGRQAADVAPERDEEAVAAVPTAAPPRPEAPPHEPMAAGTYAVYDDGQGGVVLVIGTREGETIHRQIPAGLIKAGEMMMGGHSPLAALLGKFF